MSFVRKSTAGERALMTQCLGDTQLLHLLQGRLPSVEISVFESHIDGCPDCQDLIEDLARAELPAADSLRELSSLRGDEPSTDPGTISRRYTQPEVIGQGGMGQVSRVFDRLTGQWVALKRMSMRPSASSDLLSVLAARTGCSSSALSLHGKRLLLAKEFRTLASLRHPNIVSVLDYGFDSSREPYFTMELLEDAFPLLPFAAAVPRELQIELLVELLRALSYLHRRGVLHRDTTRKNKICSLTGHKATHRRRTDDADALFTHWPL